MVHVNLLTSSPRSISDDGAAGPVSLAVAGAHFEEVLGLRLHIPDDGRGDVTNDGLDKPLAVLRPPVHRVLDHVTVDAPVRILWRPPGKMQRVVLVSDHQIPWRRPGSGLLRSG